MQKVERKKHRDGKHRRLIWLLAAFVLLAGSVTAAVLLSRKPEETIIERDDHSGLMVDRRTEELVKVTEQIEIVIKKKSVESLLDEIKMPGKKYAVTYLTAYVSDYRKMKEKSQAQ